MYRTSQPSRSSKALVGVIAVAAVVFAACSASGAATSSAPAAATAAPASAAPASAAPASDAPSAMAGEAYEVKSVQDATLGAYLAGEDGRTLYVFLKDTGGTSACTGACATTWPPFTIATDDTLTPGDGVTGKFATIKRDDGSLQVTYEGAPLYYFAKDTKAGDVNGQGVGGVWFVAAVAGGPGGASASPTPAASPATSGTTASIVDFAFQPATLTVPVGTTITWTNTGATAHTVTADDGSFDSASVAPGQTFSHAFTTAGTFTYHCAIHPSMTATVTVQ